MTRYILLPALCLGLLVASHQTTAQVIYKSIMPDGRVIYGSEPAPGAKKVESMAPRTDDAGVRVSTPDQEKAFQQRQQQRDQQSAQRPDLAGLEKAVKDAEAAQLAGKEPQEGERIGTAGGYSRFTDAYWERQKELEQAVEEARRRLEQARSGQ